MHFNSPAIKISRLEVTGNYSLTLAFSKSHRLHPKFNYKLIWWNWGFISLQKLWKIVDKCLKNLIHDVQEPFPYLVIKFLKNNYGKKN